MSLKGLYALADQFEIKLAQQLATSQSGTTELFFDNEEKQRAFNQAISDPNGPVGKFLIALATKTQKTASFDLKVNAEPGKGAIWILNVTPHSSIVQVDKLLNAEFGRIVGGTMAARTALANQKTREGAGSGQLDIGSFSADM